MAIDSLKNPLVSVIIPSYNGEEFIMDTVASVRSQSYTNLEIIVIDDGSTDSTFRLLSTLQSDPRIQVIRNAQNRGASFSRNIGFNNSTGQLIKFLDGDDLLNEQMIASQVAFAEIDDCLVSAKWGRFYENDLSKAAFVEEDCWKTMSGVKWICSSWSQASSMTNPGIFLIPRQTVLKAGLWDISLSLLDDTEYFTRTILAVKKVIFCPDAILYYRSGLNNNLSSKFQRNHAESACKAVLKSVNYLHNASHKNEVRLLCANTLRYLQYKLYPDFKDLCLLLEKKINLLGGSTIQLPASKKIRFVKGLFGWKLARKFQHYSNKWRS